MVEFLIPDDCAVDAYKTHCFEKVGFCRGRIFFLCSQCKLGFFEDLKLFPKVKA